jgi:hypothetical protein
MGIKPKFKVPKVDEYGLPIPENAKSFVPFDHSEFELEEVNHGDEFTAVKPWVGAIKPPSAFIKPLPRFDLEPELDLKLEYVYGYRVKYR